MTTTAIIAHLRARLPELKRTLKALERAKRVSRKTLERRFTI
jgi:hypothetical protein